MALDAVRTTLSMATLIGGAVKERAGELAGGVFEIPGVGPSAMKALELGGQASALVEEVTALLSTNRTAITDVLRAEIGLQLQRMGLSTPDSPDTTESSRAEIDRLKAEVADLRKALEATSAQVGRTPMKKSTKSASTAAAKKAARASASTRKASGPKPAAKTTPVKKAVARKPAAPRSAVQKAPTTRSSATKPVSADRERTGTPSSDVARDA